MSELLSKEVEEIVDSVYFDWFKDELSDREALRSALRSVLLLAAKEMCKMCREGHIPSEHGLHATYTCAAAPIHKMLRGEK